MSSEDDALDDGKQILYMFSEEALSKGGDETVVIVRARWAGGASL